MLAGLVKRRHYKDRYRFSSSSRQSSFNSALESVGEEGMEVRGQLTRRRDGINPALSASLAFLMVARTHLTSALLPHTVGYEHGARLKLRVPYAVLVVFWLSCRSAWNPAWHLSLNLVCNIPERSSTPWIQSCGGAAKWHFQPAPPLLSFILQCLATLQCRGT